MEVIIPTRNAPEVLWLALTHLFAYGRGAVSQTTLLDNCSTTRGGRAPGSCGTRQTLAYGPA